MQLTKILVGVSRSTILASVVFDNVIKYLAHTHCNALIKHYICNNKALSTVAQGSTKEKDQNLTIRISKVDKEMIAELAEKLGYSVSDFLINLVKSVKDNKDALNNIRPKL